MWEIFAVALALMLVFEGMLPFLMPDRWRKMMLQVAQLNDQSLRMMGFLSMAAGLVLLLLVNG